MFKTVIKAIICSTLLLVTRVCCSSNVENNIGTAVINILNTTAAQRVSFLNSSMPEFAVSSTFLTHRRNRTIISILASINYSGKTAAPGPVCTEAIELALERLHSQPNWLPNYELVVEMFDDECDDVGAIRKVLGKLEEKPSHRLPALIVPQCPTKAQTLTAAAMKQFNYVGTSVYVNDLALSRNRLLYSNFFGMGYDNLVPPNSVFSFIVQSGWRKIIVFSEMLPYYDEMDNVVTRMAEERKVELRLLAKVNYLSTDSNEMASALSLLKASGVRIIWQLSDSSIAFSCWLYRFGMYGPNYIVISSIYSYFDAGTVKIPLYVSSWCTYDMLAKVIKSWIFYGAGRRPDVVGSNAVDSTGISSDQFSQAMREKILNADKSPYWVTWPQICYDETILLGYMLNAADQLLQKRNETLSQWTVGTMNFQNNGKQIVDLLKEGLYLTEVAGMRGEYRFDSKTTTNSLGFTPMLFARSMPKNGKFERANFAYYKSNTDSFVQFSGERSPWETADGFPPKDSVRMIRVLQPLLTTPTVGVLIAFGIAGILASCVFLSYPSIKEKLPVRFSGGDFQYFDGCIIVGNLIMLSHVFALPLDKDAAIERNCSAIDVLLISGYSLSIAGTLARLFDAEDKYVPNTTHYLPARFAVRGSGTARRTSKVLNNVSKTFTHRHFSPTFVKFWFVVHTVLILVFIFVRPFKSGPVATFQQASREDSSVVYEFYVMRCYMDEDYTGDSTTMGLILTMVILQALVLLRAALLAYQLISGSKGHIQLPDEVKIAASFVYCAILTLIAGAVIVIIRSWDSAYIQIVISSTAIAFSFLSNLLLVAPKLFKAKPRRETLNVNEQKHGDNKYFSRRYSGQTHLAPQPPPNTITQTPQK